MNDTKNAGKTTATIAAIRDYDNMCLIIANTPDMIKERYEDLATPRNTKLDGMPKTNNPFTLEDIWVEGLEKLDLMQKRYYKAEMFVMWFEPMWLSLSNQERMILETYKHSDTRSGSIARLATELNYSTRQLSRMRQKALSLLSELLYGH